MSTTKTLSADQSRCTQKLLTAVCEVYEIDASALCGREFYEPLMEARNVAMYLARQQTIVSGAQMAIVLKRNPKAASYAFYHIATLRATRKNLLLEERVQKIQTLLDGKAAG